jgi:hypothetical protein
VVEVVVVVVEVVTCVFALQGKVKVYIMKGGVLEL